MPERSTLLRREYLPPALTALALLLGLAIRLLVSVEAGNFFWLAALAVLGLPLIVRTARQALKGEFATDIVASLAVGTAIALMQPFAGLVVVLMQTGGEALERYAAGRASSALQHLEAAAPRSARRLVGERVEDIPAESVAVGDELLVRPGEMVPCDGVVVTGTTLIDASQLTGEAFPVRVVPGSKVMSGSLVGDSALVIRAQSLAAESQYARIVQLVRSAQLSKAPIQRLADRYAVWFTPATLLVCVIAYAASGDALRVLSVLVVATPCPLILAAPVAIVGGINRAARHGIIVRNGGALELVGTCTTIFFDKTGTLTAGHPEVARVVVTGELSEEELLSRAGAVEQASSHLLARTLVKEVERRGIPIPVVQNPMEYSGRGVTGTVNGENVIVGSRTLVRELEPGLSIPSEDDSDGVGQLRAYVVVGGRLAGAVEFADVIRDGVSEMLAQLRDMGAQRVVLLSGDDSRNAVALAKSIGIAEVYGDLLPGDKVRYANEATASGERVLMVGDGTNDAPALAAATVGIAMGGHGGGVTTESADIVLLVDDVTRVAASMRIGKRTLAVAKQSIWAGLALSGVAMIFAAFGFIAPAVGALIQEGIDVAVILNALRASSDRSQGVVPVAQHPPDLSA